MQFAIRRSEGEIVSLNIVSTIHFQMLLKAREILRVRLHRVDLATNLRFNERIVPDVGASLEYNIVWAQYAHYVPCSHWLSNSVQQEIPV